MTTSTDNVALGANVANEKLVVFRGGTEPTGSTYDVARFVSSDHPVTRWVDSGGSEYGAIGPDADKFIFGASEDFAWRTGLTSNGELYNSGSEKMRLDQNGDLGIGDTSPSTKLSLGGSGSANGITFGDDGADPANLYRSNANELTTDDSLAVGVGLSVGSGAAAAPDGGDISISNNTTTNDANLYFGASQNGRLHYDANGYAGTFPWLDYSDATIGLGIINTDYYASGGTLGTNKTCSGGQVLQNQVVTGGIVTGGSCTAPSGLQDVSDDTSPTLGGNLDADGNDITNLGALDWGGSIGAVAQWHANESSWNGTSGEVVDSVGSYDGTAQGDATTASGHLNNAGTFDGSSDYVSIPDDILDLSGDWTISMWINLASTAGTNPRTFSLVDNSNSLNLQVGYTSSNNYPYIRLDNTVVNATQSLGTGSWRHVVYKVESGVRTIYLDNTEYSTSAGGPSANTSSSAIGAQGGGSYATNGLIDEVQVYNGALSDAQVSTLYNGGTGTESTVSGSGYTADTNLYRASANTLKTDDAFVASVASTAAGTFDRQTDDGTIVSLQQAGTEEGTISVSGTTVSYNAFTGSHYADAQEDIDRAMLVSQTGRNRHLDDRRDAELLYGVKRSTKENDPAVMGAYLSVLNPKEKNGKDRSESVTNPSLVMAVGNGEVWVADTGEDLKPGDSLISSEVAGHAIKDPGTHDVSHVVAKVAEPVGWDDVKETVDADGEKVKHRKVSVFFTAFDKVNRSAGEEELQAVETKVDDLRADAIAADKERDERNDARFSDLEDDVVKLQAAAAQLRGAEAVADVPSVEEDEESPDFRSSIIGELDRIDPDTEQLKRQVEQLRADLDKRDKSILAVVSDLTVHGNLTLNDNIRGIDVAIRKGEKKLRINFERPQKDDRYSIQVEPSWLTLTAVTAKDSDGFTVEFEKIAPDEAAIDWLLVR